MPRILDHLPGRFLGCALMALATAGIVIAAALGGGQAPAAADSRGAERGLVRSDFSVRSPDGQRIAAREVRAAGRLAGDPVILIHGARVPGVASFDLPVTGGSLAADLVERGSRVFIMDVRGFGASTRPPEMSQPREQSRPLVRSDEAVLDIGAVVDAVRAKTRERQVALLGWATGGHWAGMYASQQPAKVDKLVIYNSLYGPIDGHPTLGRGGANEDPQRPGRFNEASFGGYRLNTGASLLPSWDSSIPVEDKAQWRDPRVVEAYVRAALDSDTTSQSRTPASFRAPSGPMEDTFYLATGRQLWDASTITARTLIVRSELDFWSRPQDVTTLVSHLVRARQVRTLELPQATHFVHLDRAERGRQALMAGLEDFLAPSR
ncbi:MAG TPA: alpha/beta fold hydrolase [Solirubrobacteraceae bacterium]|nr:alpha/beta fold hydrolase [Solirubrobacteraceae bacterium]